MDGVDVDKVVEVREKYEAIDEQGEDRVKGIGRPHFVKKGGFFVKEVGR